jgi:AcrR family transcriptional regulator
MPAGNRKRDSERTKREILNVAGRRFARSGYSGVSLQEIAAEVGVTAAMVIHHFGSKLGLFGAVARDEWGLGDGAELPVADAAVLAHEIVAYWNDPDVRSPSLALVRSLDTAEAVDLFRLELERRVLGPCGRQVHGPEAEQRLKLIAGLIMGFGYFTTGALLDPDAPPLDDEEAAVMSRYLTRILDVLIDQQG